MQPPYDHSVNFLDGCFSEVLICRCINRSWKLDPASRTQDPGTITLNCMNHLEVRSSHLVPIKSNKCLFSKFARQGEGGRGYPPGGTQPLILDVMNCETVSKRCAWVCANPVLSHVYISWLASISAAGDGDVWASGRQPEILVGKHLGCWWPG